MLPRASFDFVQNLVVALGSMILVAYAIPWYAIAIVIFAGTFCYLLTYFNPVSRQLKRLEAISRSPSSQLFQSTLLGLPTLRAYGRLDDLVVRFDQSVDFTTNALLSIDGCQRWVGIRMDWISIASVFLTALLVVIFRDSMSSAMAGQALSQSLLITGVLQFSARMAAESDSLMTSAERLIEYCSLPPQPDDGAGAVGHATQWPSSGKIEVRSLTASHPSNPTVSVLNKLSFEVTAGEKLAVVGRTGAGKSSLLACFFRLMEIPSDSIFVDGVDLTTLPLQSLRQRFGIIPQAPTIFNGTVRYNLDPFSKHTEDELMEALGKVQLDKAISERGGLDVSVGELGGAFSVGQKQLLCAARALLAKPKVLFMDEATANVDSATDALIQQMVRRECTGVTVVTIAHRLNTIVDYDKIAVLDRGTLVEWGSPQELLARREGVFRAMYEAQTTAQ